MIADFQGCGTGLAVELGFVSTCPGHVPATSMRNKLRTSLPGKRAQAPQYVSAHFQATHCAYAPKKQLPVVLFALRRDFNSRQKRLKVWIPLLEALK
jgi:hypothetical protein